MTGSQSVCTVLVAPTTEALFCLPPRSVRDDQTLRAPVPWYQPSRKAVTRKPDDVVETNSGNDSPDSTLALPVYPSMACSLPRWRISQCGSPGSEFSFGAALRYGRAGPVTGWLACAADGDDDVHPVAAAAAPAAAMPRKALRVVLPATTVSMPRRRAAAPGRRTIHNQYLIWAARYDSGQPSASSSGTSAVASSSGAVSTTPLTSDLALPSRPAASSRPAARAAPRPAFSSTSRVACGIVTPGTS